MRIVCLLCAGALCAGVSALAQDFGTEPRPAISPARAEAERALEARDYAGAAKLLEPLAAANPKDAAVLYDLGSAEDALDQASAAERNYRAAIADDAAMLEPRVALGLLLARGGRMEDARLEFAAAVATGSGDKLLRARAYRALARLDATSRPADARDELLEALKLSPETAEDTLLSAELAERAKGGGAAAEAAYRRLLTQRPGDPEATSALAHLLMQDKRSAEAEALLKGGLAAHPADIAMTAQLASLYSSSGRAAEALPLLEALHEGNRADGDVSHLLARLYLQTKDWARAETLLAAITAQRPDDVVLLCDRGRALIRLKRYPEAQTVLTRAVAQPTHFASPAELGDAAGDLAFAASENNDPAAALQALEVRATVLPPSAPVLFLRAISHDKLHHVRLAQEAYKEFLAASNGEHPDEEFEAQHRLVALGHMK